MKTVIFNLDELDILIRALDREVSQNEMLNRSFPQRGYHQRSEAAKRLVDKIKQTPDEKDL